MDAFLSLVRHAISFADIWVGALTSIILAIGTLLTGLATAGLAAVAYSTFSATAVKARRDDEAKQQQNLQKIRNDEEKLRLRELLEAARQASTEERIRDEAALAQLRREVVLTGEKFDNQAYETHKKNGVIEQYHVMVAQYQGDLARLAPDEVDPFTGETFGSYQSPA